MRVAVIGAGIVGATTAFELATQGCDVTVFERRGSVAAETSFANAGLVAPGYVTPWAAPGMPGKVLRQALQRHAAVRLRPTLDPRTLAWIWRWWRACKLRSYQANRARMLRLALYSRERLRQLVHELSLEYERSDGVLVLLRSPSELARARPSLKFLAESGTRFHLVDADRCRAIEPGLDPQTALHGGIHLPDDEVGNCRQFALLMRAKAQERGARFDFHAEVRRIVPGAQPRLSVVDRAPQDTVLGDEAMLEATVQPAAVGAEQTFAFDAVVVCAALGADPLLRPLGLRLPLQAVYGYSVTAPLRTDPLHGMRGPRSALMDERFKVAVSRLGSRVRVAGSAELGGNLQRFDRRAIETLYQVLHDWFPGAARLEQAQRWKGARPMLPDGPPVIGASGLPGVWLNLGHGSSGWALACGSARVVADALAGRAAAIDTEGLGLSRLRA
jgi:D-amino-acid dehydrogenase